jgi:hypothetical protein
MQIRMVIAPRRARRSVREGERTSEVAKAEFLFEVMLVQRAPAGAEPAEQRRERPAAQRLRAARTARSGAPPACCFPVSSSRPPRSPRYTRPS